MMSEDECVRFCDNIRYLRKKHHLSKKEMAQIMDTEPGILESIESGSIPKRLSVFSLIQLAVYCQIRPEDIFLPPEQWHTAGSSRTASAFPDQSIGAAR
ncbi:MAG TPA: helix-turn-helix domain-containing protein [Firmicutes bacterium]|nr:helix-turn-helix domain-containing protein [Bacillota bacterium]